MFKGILVLVCLIYSVNSGSVSWLYVGSGCTGARDSKFSELTYKGTPGFMGAVKLVYKSGYVGCTQTARSNWGCFANKNDIRIVVTDGINQIIYPAPRLAPLGPFGGYSLPGFTSSSPELVIADFGNPTYLKNGDKLRVWYAEDLKGLTESDNSHSKTCMDVYVHQLSI